MVSGCGGEERGSHAVVEIWGRDGRGSDTVPPDGGEEAVAPAFVVGRASGSPASSMGRVGAT
jgi:hypothetical protein